MMILPPVSAETPQASQSGGISLVKTFTVSANSVFVVYNPFYQRIYASLDVSYGQGFVAIIDGSSQRVVKTVGLGDQAAGLAVDPANGNVYVVSHSSVFVINPKGKILSNIPLSTQTGNGAIVYDPQNRELYVDSLTGLFVIDTSTNILSSSISLPGTPGQLAYDSGRNAIYASYASISQNGTDRVFVIDASSNQLVASIPICTYCHAYDLAYDSTNSMLYLSTPYDVIYAIDDSNNTVVSSFQIGPGQNVYFFGDLYVPTTGLLYVASDYLPIIFAVNPSTGQTVGGLTLPQSGPWLLAFDSANGDIYLTNNSNPVIYALSIS